MRFLAGLLLTLILIGPTRAQSPENWSQTVRYEMDIHLKADRHRVHGEQRLTYTNNSPDTLHTVYYHLYFNAFHPNSMMATRNRQLPDPDGRIVPRIFNLDESEQGWHKIQSLTQDGTPVDWKISDTVMRVDLADSIAPGESTTFDMQFRSQVPLQTRRSGRDSRGDRIDYTMTQWYPKMAEYDERGWHADPYVNREFYAPYGTFDVEITLPAEYTIGATGLLQNAGEIGHGYDIDGSGTWRPSTYQPDSDSLTWHFTAENVHDFAWSADPEYIHDKVVADGTTHHILYKPNVAEQWRPLKNDMPRLTRFFSSQYGAYPYPQMTVAQGGDGGMEYPMFTVVSSYDGPAFERKSGRRSVLGTTVHEFAHMWYYAALGTNESDYAWMDEGFTSYATSEGFAHLTGSTARHSPLSIVRLQKLGLLEPFSTPADWFTTNAAYGVASYPGGEMLVDMLSYVIGDEQRDQWLKRYLHQRKYQHPDPFDIELFAEQVSGLKLDWYFWQFTRTTRKLDDAIANLDQRRTSGGYEVSLTLKREGEAVMPQDVRLTLADGSVQWVNVPLLIMHGHKPVPDHWIVTEPWPWVAPKKTFTFTVPARVESAEIDPQGRTPDVNRLNNTASLPVRSRFLHPPQPSWFDYSIGYRPLVQYADDFGFGAGMQLRGRYFLGNHAVRGMLKLWPEVLFGDEDPGDFSLDGIDFEFSYTANVNAFGPQATLGVETQKHLGIWENQATFTKPLSDYGERTDRRLQLALTHQLAPTERVFTIDGFYPTLPNDQHIVSARLDYRIEEGQDHVAFMAEVGSGLTRTFQFSASRFRIDAAKTTALGPFRSSAHIAFGMGAGNLAPHKNFRLGAGSFEERWRNDAFRSVAALSDNAREDWHWVALDQPGPHAYLTSSDARQSPAFIGGTPTGRNLLAGSLQLSTGPLAQTSLLRHFEADLFSGIGSAWSDGLFLAGFDSDDLIADAGLGLRFDLGSVSALQRWSAQSDVLSGLQLTAKFPVWASDPERIDSDQDELEFRWLIGVDVGL